MPSPYTSPTKLTSSVLIHLGNLQSNLVAGGVPPSEFLVTADSVPVGVQFPGAGDATDPPPFVHFDAGVMLGANYDEIILDVGPTVTWQGSVLGANINTQPSTTGYRQVASTGRPFWLMVRLDGYGVPQLFANADVAMSTALAVLGAFYSDMVGYQLLARFRGFAFLRPDLNVLYTDGSALSRHQQNLMVQTAWQLGRAACFVTSRPEDALTLIGPTLTTNSNSGAKLDHPIIGCNVAQVDKVVVLYPNLQAGGQNISVVIGQVSATLTASNRDPGFTPQIDFAYAVPMDDDFWTPDGAGGVTANDEFDVVLARICNFCAAMGVDEFGLYGVTSAFLDVAGRRFPAPNVFLPPDASVNTTGSSLTWGSDGRVFVAYAAPAGADPSTITREFDADFVEVVPYAGPVYP